MSVIDLALVLAGQVFTAGAIYGAIRADIRHHAEGIKEAKDSAGEAHRRIDTLLAHK